MWKGFETIKSHQMKDKHIKMSRISNIIQLYALLVKTH